MAGEETEESISVTVSGDLVDWLDDRATEADGDRETVVRDLLAAYRSVASENGDLDGLVEDVVDGDVERRLDEQRDEYVDMIQDVRQRVIQVKRETDRKAPADHDHSELHGELDAATAELSDLESTVADLQSTVEEVRRDLDDGFQNYEDVLRYLKDRTERMEDTLDTLGSAVLDVREATKRVAAESASRSEADRLKATANKQGFREADCEECGSTVDLALLATARCPHCSANFVDVEGKSGFFGSPKLATGSAPALEGKVGGEDDLEDVVGGSADEESTFEWQDADAGGEES